MTDSHLRPGTPSSGSSAADSEGRRSFLARMVIGVQALIGGVVGVVLGGAVVSPGLVRRDESWLPAGKMADLVPGQPVAVPIRVARQDGYAQVVDRRTVFLIRNGDAVTALDSTCTHLGCRVSWNAETKSLNCPCHGGVFDTTGAVTSGPPPGPLRAVQTRIDDGQVMVQL